MVNLAWGISSMGGQRVAELDICSCGPWTNLVISIWSSNAGWLHTPVLKHHSWL